MSILTGRQNFSISQRKQYQNPVNWFLRGIVASHLMSLSILATWEFQFTVSVAGRLASRIQQFDSFSGWRIYEVLQRHG